MSNSTIITIAVIAAVMLLLILYLLFGRKQHVRLSEPERVAPVVRKSAPAAAIDVPPVVVPQAERHGIGSEVSAAIEDVIDQFVGLDAHPSGRQPELNAGDDLTRLKGLGPRAAFLLGQLGVTRFDQMAQWDEGDIAAIDAQMRAFKGRIQRDRWVEQAKLLAAGDIAAFEERFGKLGS